MCCGISNNLDLEKRGLNGQGTDHFIFWGVGLGFLYWEDKVFDIIYLIPLRMNGRGITCFLNALIGDIGTATYEGMKEIKRALFFKNIFFLIFFFTINRYLKACNSWLVLYDAFN